MMDTAGRVKLRPDTHYAPVSKGVYWSRSGGRSFVLSGPRSLFGLIDARLDLLTAGTCVDDLVRSVGDETARPVFAHIVDTLLDQDMLFDVDAAGPVPDAATAARYADVLGYLEARCDRPYEAFARLRSARITVLGAGPAAANVIRGLAGYGIVPAAGAIEAGPSDLTVLIDDAEHRIEVATVAAELAAGTPLLPVLAGVRMAMVGPLIRDAGQIGAFVAGGARVDDWLRADGIAAAPRPLSAAFAGSLAARAVLDELLGPAGADGYATVIHGGTLECQRVPLTIAPVEPPWRDLDAADGLPEEPPVVAPPAIPDDPDAPPLAQDPDSIHQRAARLTARWTGLLRWGDDLDLPQLPVALATVRNVTVPGMTPSRDLTMRDPAGPSRVAVLGWGIDRADAGADALLSTLRATATEQIPAQPGWVAAAGTSGRRFVVDGLLRLIAPPLLESPAQRELTVDDAGSWIGRSLWSVVTDYFATPVRLSLRETPGLAWALVTATDGDGAVLTHQWGPTLATAVHAALAAVTAGCQLAEDPTSVATLEPMGTWALRTATPVQLDQCHDELTALAAASGRRVTGRVLAGDPVSGVLPLYAGLVGLR